MINVVLEVTPSSVIVFDGNGETCAVSIELTPHRRYLTQSTKRAILATGFLLRYGDELATDGDVINRVLEEIRKEVLRDLNGGGK